MQQWVDMIESLYMPPEVKLGLKIAIIVFAILWFMVFIKALLTKPDTVSNNRSSLAGRFWGF